MWNYEWRESAHCLTEDPDTLFASGAEQHEAKIVCRTCTVKLECLSEALDQRIEYGVWGGMTERERRSLLARRPNVPSWRILLQEITEAQPEAA